MQHAFKRIGAAIGSALMLGSTLAGAALAADVADFYDGIAVVGGSADDTLVVVGTGGTSPSGLAADVVSAIGIASEIGDHRLTPAAGGVGEVTLSVESTSVDGKTLEGQIGRFANDTLTQNNLKFYATGEGGNALSTLKTKNIQNFGGTAVKNQETITISNLDAIRFDYKAGNLVTSSDGTAGYDSTECVFPYSNQWIIYESKLDTPVDLDGSLKSQKMLFLGSEYTVLSATSTELKVAGTGSEQSLTVGDDGVEFDDASVTLESVMTQGTGGTTDKALIAVEKGGTTASKLITEGSTEVLNGVEVTILSAGPTYVGDTTVGSANILLGGSAMTLKNNQALTSGSPWTVVLATGTDTSSTETTSTGLSYVRLVYSQGATGSAAVPAGGTIAGLDELGGLLTLTCDGVSAPTYNDLKFEMVGQKDIGNFNNATVSYVMKISYPTKVFTSMGNIDTDTMYALLDETSQKTINRLYYVDTTAANNYTDSEATSKTFTIGDKQWTITVAGSDAGGSLVTLDEPTQKYPLGATNTGKVWSLYVYNNSEAYTNLGTTTAANAHLLNYTGTTSNYATPRIAWLDSSAVMKSLTNFVSLWGTKVTSVSQSALILGIPSEQAVASLTLGSTSTATETASASLGGDAVTVGGVEVSVAGSASSLSLDEWPMPVAKVDSDVTAADKAGKNLIIVGGPVVNSLTAALTDKLDAMDCAITNDDPGAGKGKVAVVADAFEDDLYAVVVAGSDRKGTTAAAQLLQVLDDFDGDLDSECVTVEYVSAGEMPTAVTAAPAAD